MNIFNLFCKKHKKNKSENFAIINKHIEIVQRIHHKMDKLDDILRSKKIDILLNKGQKYIISTWFVYSDFIYNQLVTDFMDIYNKIYKICQTKYIEGGLVFNKFLAELLSNNTEFPINRMQLRNLKIDIFKTKYDMPFCVISDVIMEFASNLKGNITKLKKGQIFNFSLKYRDYNRELKSLSIQRHYTTKDGFYPSIFGSIEIVEEKKMTKKKRAIERKYGWNDIACDYKLIHDCHKNIFHIQAPIYKEKKASDKYERKPIAIMDPGMRTFQQLYGLNHIISIGDDMYHPIMDILKEIEKMQDTLNNGDPTIMTKLKKINLKRAMRRKHRKIKNMVTELHNKTCIFLCKTYDRIMVTDFSSKKVNGKEKKLDKNVKKVLGKLSHYKFRQRLALKCEEYRCQYLEVTEEYTSKTCCKCGTLHENLGSSKIFDCKVCKQKIGRDVGGSIGIFIKNRNFVLD